MSAAPPRVGQAAEGSGAEPPRAASGSFRAVWGAPIVLAIMTGGGLVAGLLGDGGWDVASWCGLGLPLAVGAWYALKR